MKSTQLISASVLLLPLLVILVHCQPREIDPDADLRLTATDTLTLAQTRDLKVSDAPGRIYLTDAGKQGLFVLDRADRSTVDNTGTVLVTATGRRYKREYSGPTLGLWFGLSSTDDDISPELQQAVHAANGELIIPDGNYVQQKEVRIHSNLSIKGTPGKVTITLPKSYVSLVNPVNTSGSLDNVLIEGINWIVTATGTGTYGVITVDGPSITNFTVQQCRSTDAAAKDSTNFLTVKIQAGKTGSNIVVRQNDIRARRMAIEIFNHDNPSIYAGTNIVVSENSVHECHFGISLSGPLDGALVEKNYVKNCSLYGIEIAGALRNVRILDNRFEGTFDKFLEGSNDGNGNGSLQGGMIVTGNQTVGTCTGGIQLFNGKDAQVTNNTFNMTGRLELLTLSSSNGTYTNNRIESGATHAVICDNAPGNVFRDNIISNKGASANLATFRAYGPRATGIVVSGNRFGKGPGGAYLDAVEGASYSATSNIDEIGNAVH